MHRREILWSLSCYWFSDNEMEDESNLYMLNTVSLKIKITARDILRYVDMEM
jgi:hypothetical protein